LTFFYEKCEKFEKVHLYVVFGRIGLQKNHILVDHACNYLYKMQNFVMSHYGKRARPVPKIGTSSTKLTYFLTLFKKNTPVITYDPKVNAHKLWAITVGFFELLAIKKIAQKIVHVSFERLASLFFSNCSKFWECNSPTLDKKHSFSEKIKDFFLLRVCFATWIL
jgi:hypothetical protein